MQKAHEVWTPLNAYGLRTVHKHDIKWQRGEPATDIIESFYIDLFQSGRTSVDDMVSGLEQATTLTQVARVLQLRNLFMTQTNATAVQIQHFDLFFGVVVKVLMNIPFFAVRVSEQAAKALLGRTDDGRVNANAFASLVDHVIDGAQFSYASYYHYHNRMNTRALLMCVDSPGEFFTAKPRATPIEWTTLHSCFGAVWAVFWESKDYADYSEPSLHIMARAASLLATRFLYHGTKSHHRVMARTALEYATYWEGLRAGKGFKSGGNQLVLLPFVAVAVFGCEGVGERDEDKAITLITRHSLFNFKRGGLDIFERTGDSSSYQGFMFPEALGDPFWGNPAAISRRTHKLFPKQYFNGFDFVMAKEYLAAKVSKCTMHVSKEILGSHGYFAGAIERYFRTEIRAAVDRDRTDPLDAPFPGCTCAAIARTEPYLLFDMPLFDVMVNRFSRSQMCERYRSIVEDLQFEPLSRLFKFFTQTRAQSAHAFLFCLKETTNPLLANLPRDIVKLICEEVCVTRRWASEENYLAALLALQPNEALTTCDADTATSESPPPAKKQRLD